MPQVSVILPTRNRAATLARAVRSVLAQSYRDLELLVVDDGSTDNTAELLQCFDDPRLRVLKHPPPHGAAAARNFAAAQARGEWLAFQDSDDEWLVDKLYRQMREVERDPAVDLLCCGYLIQPHDAQPVRYQGADTRMQRGEWGDDNITRFSFITPTWLLRRCVFEALQGFDQQMPNLEDWEFSFRLYKQARIRVLNEPLVLKHGAPDSLNWDARARQQSLQLILSRHRDLWAGQPQVRAGLLRELGHWYARTGEMGAARQHFRAAWQACPRSWRNLLTLLAALGGQAGYALLQRLRGVRA